jgi:hypothetical protein
MTSFGQIQTDRRNAQLSTGPVTEEGKTTSQQNAVRHGLTAETVIDALEDAEDYAAFEMAITADYDAQSAVERELVLRLASLLWRLRRATAIESGLFKIQARHLLDFRQRRLAHQKRQNIIDNICREAVETEEDTRQNEDETTAGLDLGPQSATSAVDQSDDLTRAFVRLSNLPTYPLDRLSYSLAPGLSDPVHAAISRPTQAMGKTKIALILAAHAARGRNPVRLRHDGGNRERHARKLVVYGAIDVPSTRLVAVCACLRQVSGVPAGV